MVRMMMWDRKTGDENFKATMRDFVKTYSGKAATTEDFKAMMEKHMTPEMDLDGNHRLDWFFDEYVYGTALPTYKLTYTFEKNPEGNIVFGFKVTQSGVDEKFKMIVPIYLELADGRTVNLGRARLIGNSSIEQKIPMNGLKDAPKRAVVNYNDDVLASN
jgi:aminopeptidase N